MLHLTLFEEPLGLAAVHLPLVLLQEVYDVGEGDLRGCCTPNHLGAVVLVYSVWVLALELVVVVR